MMSFSVWEIGFGWALTHYRHRKAQFIFVSDRERESRRFDSEHILTFLTHANREVHFQISQTLTSELSASAGP